MSDQILNNKQIDELIKNGVIELSPNYDSSKLQIAQYPLHSKTIWQIGHNGNIVEVFKFDKINLSFKLQPKQYYLVDVEENIKLPKGIIGRFIPSSNFLEKGITLTSGKIEYPYGQNKEKIRFGVYNCLDFETTIEKEDRIAYIQFIDLRGQDSLDYKLNEYDKRVYNGRIYNDADAPNYELDMDDE